MNEFKKEDSELKITKEKISRFKKICESLYLLFKEETPNAKLNIIWNIVLIILIVSFLKIPFILVRYFGDTLIQYLKVDNLYTIWGLIIEIIYLYFAIIIFINTFIKYFGRVVMKGVSKPHVSEAKIGEELRSISLTKEEKEIEPK